MHDIPTQKSTKFIKPEDNIDVEEMFAQADRVSTAKAISDRRNTDIQISMTHASVDEQPSIQHKTGKFKSRIGGAVNAESTQLTVTNSKPAKYE